jgi:hypothetical protein
MLVIKAKCNKTTLKLFPLEGARGLNTPKSPLGDFEYKLLNAALP